MNNPIDTSLFDKAAAFAIAAHGGTERRGKGTPYVIHPMEAAAIVASITNDPEMLAAAVLHDVVEDTAVTADELRQAFGDRVTRLVLHDTASDSATLGWRGKRQGQIERLRAADRDGKIVALGDKLSNLRAIAGDYTLLGDALWQRFHAPQGRVDIEWYYRGLAGALIELSETIPYREFVALLDNTFGFMNYGEATTVSLDDYVESGGGYCSTSYNHRDGVTMVKFYDEGAPLSLPQNELRTAHAVFRMGIPSPMPGRLVTDGRRFGAEFRRISPKESFARFVSNRRDRCEEIGHRFAKMCRDLHAKPCNTSLFASESEYVMGEIRKSRSLTAEEQEHLCRLVEAVPLCRTCLHGDMHIGNVITTDLDEKTHAAIHDFWIDLGDFRWGNPLFDLGMAYLTFCNPDEAITQRLFHIGSAEMQRIWKTFAEDYFGAHTDAERHDIERRLAPFAALKMVHFDLVHPMPEPMRHFVQKTAAAASQMTTLESTPWPTL